VWGVRIQVVDHPADVRFGSLADITARPRHVRFTPESGLKSDIASRPFCAVSGNPKVNNVTWESLRFVGECVPQRRQPIERGGG
jgi:hypothetical protein